MRRDSEHNVGKGVGKDEAASTEGGQAGNCGSSRNRRDATEERARLTSEAGVRPAIAEVNYAPYKTVT